MSDPKTLSCGKKGFSTNGIPIGTGVMCNIITKSFVQYSFAKLMIALPIFAAFLMFS